MKPWIWAVAAGIVILLFIGPLMPRGLYLTLAAGFWICVLVKVLSESAP